MDFIKDKFRTILIILVFAVGLGVLLYPTISDQWNKHRARQLMTDYEEAVANTSKEDLSQMWEDARAYNATLSGEILPDAFATRTIPQRDYDYEAVLNPAGDGMMGRVEIPCIKVDLPIFHYTSEEVLEKGAGHLAGSSVPVGGKSTHSVISAHRGLPSARLFTDLDRVKEGDVFYLHILDKTLAYQVDMIKVIVPSDTSDLSITEGKDYCTLFTCTPYAVNTHRLLVRGHRIPYSEAEYNEENSHTAGARWNMVLLRILCIIAGLAAAFLIVYFVNRRNAVKQIQAQVMLDFLERMDRIEQTASGLHADKGGADGTSTKAPPEP